jgi:magnesium transporter
VTTPEERAAAREEQLEQLRACVAERAAERAGDCLAGLHPSDVADLVEDLEEEERPWVIASLPPARAAEVLAEIEPDRAPERLIEPLPPDRGAAILARMADDDAADLLGPLSAEARERIVASLPSTRARTLLSLLRYDEESAGGIMTTELVALAAGLNAGEAIEELRRQAHDQHEPFYSVFVTEDGGRLAGIVGLRDLVLAAPEVPLRELAEEPPATVPPELDQEEVARQLRQYRLPDVPVVSAEGLLLGRVTWDDAMEVVEEEQTEDVLRLSGTDPDEQVRGGWGHAVRTRLPWLLVNLATGALAALIVYLFENTIDQLVVLAAIMPVIAGLGGNAGTQSLAVTIRRLAMEGGLRTGRAQVALKELLVGLANGAAVGLVIGVVGLLWQGDMTFGLVVLAAMWGNLVVASLAGALVPIVLDRIGADPAVASAVFVTTFTDIAGFFLLLGLATAVLL